MGRELTKFSRLAGSLGLFHPHLSDMGTATPSFFKTWILELNPWSSYYKDSDLPAKLSPWPRHFWCDTMTHGWWRQAEEQLPLSQPTAGNGVFWEGQDKAVTELHNRQVDTCGTQTLPQRIDGVDSPLAQEPQQLKPKEDTATGSSPTRLHTSVFSFL